MFEFSKYIKKDGGIDRAAQVAASIVLFFIRKVFLFRKNENSRILIISLHKLGDTVFTVPAIKSLKKVFASGITIVCYEESRKIYELVFDNLEYLTLKKNDFHLQGRIANSVSRKKVNYINAGTIIDLTGAVNSASLIFNNRAIRITGFNEKYFKNIYTDFIPKRKIPHLMDLYLDAAKLLAKIDDENKIKRFEKSIKKDGYILIHPFAGWKEKEWKFEKFIELYLRICNSYRSKFIIPKERADDKIVTLLKSKNISFVITDDISEMIEVIKNSSIVIGCDSGAVYIASLLGKPTFTIYGPTNPEFSLPFGEHHDFIQRKLECSPGSNEQYCFTDAGRKCPAIYCMNLLTVEEVIVKLNSFLPKFMLNNISKMEKETSA